MRRGTARFAASMKTKNELTDVGVSRVSGPRVVVLQLCTWRAGAVKAGPTRRLGEGRGDGCAAKDEDK